MLRSLKVLPPLVAADLVSCLGAGLVSGLALGLASGLVSLVLCLVSGLVSGLVLVLISTLVSGLVLVLVGLVSGLVSSLVLGFVSGLDLVSGLLELGFSNLEVVWLGSLEVVGGVALLLVLGVLLSALVVIGCVICFLLEGGGTSFSVVASFFCFLSDGSCLFVDVVAGEMSSIPLFCFVDSLVGPLSLGVLALYQIHKYFSFNQILKIKFKYPPAFCAIICLILSSLAMVSNLD